MTDSEQARREASTVAPTGIAFRRRKLLRGFELLVAFVLLPTAFWLGWLPLNVLGALWLFAALALGVLWWDPEFERNQLSFRRHRPVERQVVRRFLVLAAALAVATVLLWPARFFILVEERPLLWVLIMVLYPILSVLPQGILYRVFFFHRYAELFPGSQARIWASAVIFAYSHVVMDNWVAVALTLPGGWLFASTFEHSRSHWHASFEHALFGCWVITVGLGHFLFYQG